LGRGPRNSGLLDGEDPRFGGVYSGGERAGLAVWHGENMVRIRVYLDTLR